VKPEDGKSDAELLQAWQEGAPEAARLLIARYTPRLYDFFASKVARGADELVQQTLADCVAAHERIAEDGHRNSVRAFLFTIARRRLLNHFRAWRRHGARLDPLLHSLADVEPGVSEAVAQLEEQRRLRRALRQLPVDAQVALELRYWEGLSIPEIARVVDAAEGTVKARLSRARVRLRELLADEGPDAPRVEALLTGDDTR
jgi:RNA polymerase sigma-70 factor (ECF subfamily)